MKNDLGIYINVCKRDVLPVLKSKMCFVMKA